MLSVKKLIPFTSRGSQSSKSHKPTLIEELVLGFIAGVASRAVSTPLNIITLRTQTEREEDEDEDDVDRTRSPRPVNSGGIVEIVKLIYKEQGLAGFWRGQYKALLFDRIARLTSFADRFPDVDTIVTEPLYHHGLSANVSEIARAPQIQFVIIT